VPKITSEKQILSGNACVGGQERGKRAGYEAGKRRRERSIQGVELSKQRVLLPGGFGERPGEGAGNANAALNEIGELPHATNEGDVVCVGDGRGGRGRESGVDGEGK